MLSFIMNNLLLYFSVALVLTSVCRSEGDTVLLSEPQFPHPPDDGNRFTVTSNSSSSFQHLSSDTMMDSSYWCNDQHEDFVHFIPGYVPVAPPSCWYSGYVSYEIAGTMIHTHYLLQTAELLSVDRTNESIENPFVKPLIYWSNGGPGASSMFGLLTELGNLLFSEESLKTDEYRKTGIPTPIYNPNSWTRLGHVLSFDQPAPIGFSYCGNISDPNNITHPHSCNGIVWNDELTAQAAYQALVSFYAKFPMFYDIDLYLSGESYAGIYIPTLAREILYHNDHASTESDVTLPLRGFAVGDGCLGTETGICGNLDPESGFDLWNAIFLAGHGQMPLTTFHAVMQACYHPTSLPHLKSNDFVSVLFRGLRTDPIPSSQTGSDDNLSCAEALKIMDEQVGGVYAYGLYDDCTYSNGIKSTRKQSLQLVYGGLNDYPCGGDLVMADYLNLSVVHEALHVRKTDFFSVDNAEGDFDYIPSERDLTNFYKEVNGKLRVLVYNGDVDPAINSFAAQNWTSHLGFDEIESWRPWTVDSCRRMGGYITKYSGNFDFLTIRGAGHMVPTNKAQAAFTFMKAWVENSEYPPYDKNCDTPNIAKFTKL